MLICIRRRRRRRHLLLLLHPQSLNPMIIKPKYGMLSPS
jgi:hypothetical protein